YSKAAIVKALELDPRTVAKYYAMEEEEFRAYRQEHLFREKAFDGLRSEILEVYGANGYQPLPVSSVYDYLEERYGGLPGNEQTLRNYVAYLIETENLRLADSVRLYGKVPELPFGKQMQLDFGRYQCRSGLALYIFAAVLSASHYKYVVFQGQPLRTLDLIRHLLDCLDYFRGRPEELVIDQDRLMVVSENAGDIIYTEDFKHLIEESVQASNYQLPHRYKNKTVEIYTTAEELFVFDVFTGKEIICYRLSLIPGQVVSTRSFRKEGETTVEELKSAVAGLFELETWRRFVERNFKTFPRYARDQCLEAKRFFAEKEVNPALLERALAYCLENDTLSFSNLRDTYVHFERESRQPEPVSVVEREGLSQYQPLNVSQRSVSDYEEAARERAVS
ncbi:MAG: hypothetical protein ACUVV5_09445, partial [Candidatus Aminicenantales bacterium]